MKHEANKLLDQKYLTFGKQSGVLLSLEKELFESKNVVKEEKAGKNWLTGNKSTHSFLLCQGQILPFGLPLIYCLQTL